MLCGRYIASLGRPSHERESEALELFSEVITKLLGAASRPRPPDGSTQGDGSAETEALLPGDDGEEASSATPLPASWITDEADPKRDGRVAWLIAEVGGRRAIAHRYEDMRRQRWGRWQQSGYRTVQISALQDDAEGGGLTDDEVLSRLADSSHPLEVEPHEPLHLQDTRRVWSGMLVLADRQFGADDDVATLLKLLAHDPEIQASFGGEWPVRQIANALNAHNPERAWNDDRVDNAKKRLRNWIGRLKRDQGLDSTDLMALFARCAREQERRTAPAAATPNNKARPQGSAGQPSGTPHV